MKKILLVLVLGISFWGSVSADSLEELKAELQQFENESCSNIQNRRFRSNCSGLRTNAIKKTKNAIEKLKAGLATRAAEEKERLEAAKTPIEKLETKIAGYKEKITEFKKTDPNCRRLGCSGLQNKTLKDAEAELSLLKASNTSPKVKEEQKKADNSKGKGGGKKDPPPPEQLATAKNTATDNLEAKSAALGVLQAKAYTIEKEVEADCAKILGLISGTFDATKPKHAKCKKDKLAKLTEEPGRYKDLQDQIKPAKEAVNKAGKTLADVSKQINAADLAELVNKTAVFKVGKYLNVGQEHKLVLGGNGENDLIGRIINLLASIIGTVAILFLVIGAFFMITSRGDDNLLQKGKSIVLFALLGVALAFTAYIIVQFVIAIIFA